VPEANLDRHVSNRGLDQPFFRKKQNRRVRLYIGGRGKHLLGSLDDLSKKEKASSNTSNSPRKGWGKKKVGTFISRLSTFSGSQNSSGKGGIAKRRSLFLAEARYQGFPEDLGGGQGRFCCPLTLPVPQSRLVGTRFQAVCSRA